MKRLTKLANKYLTDKGTEFGDCHGYTEFYQQFFEKYDSPKILEVGIYEGGSIKMMNDFFDGDCEIWGCDIYENYGEYIKDMPNAHFIQVDAGDKESVESLRKKVEGVGFDIIIDDASHIWQHQMNLLSSLHTLLNDGGIYILEDIHYSRFFVDPENSPLFFLNFLFPNIMLTDEENDELIGKIKDVQIFSRKNHSGEMVEKYGGRSMTAVITFDGHRKDDEGDY